MTLFSFTVAGLGIPGDQNLQSIPAANEKEQLQEDVSTTEGKLYDILRLVIILWLLLITLGNLTFLPLILKQPYRHSDKSEYSFGENMELTLF